jgi:hypothetical protein
MWVAVPATGSGEAYRFRFRARRFRWPFRLWEDFGPENRFEWTTDVRSAALAWFWGELATHRS